MEAGSVATAHHMPVGQPMDTDESLRQFLEKEREKEAVNKHRTAIEAPVEDRCMTRRQASFRVRDEEDSINILVLGREKSGKSSLIAAATQCQDFRYFEKKKLEVSTKVSIDKKLSKIATFEAFQLKFTEVSFEALTSPEITEQLRDGSFWAAIWMVDLSRLTDKGGLKEELTQLRKVLEEPLEVFGIRGVLVCETRKQDLLETYLRTERKPEVYSNMLVEFYTKVEEWKEHIERVVHTTCPFPDNPPNVDSMEYVRNVKRSLRLFLIEEGIDVIPWGSHIKIHKQIVFPRKVGLLFAGISEKLAKEVDENSVGIPKDAIENESEEGKDENGDKSGDGSEANKPGEIQIPGLLLTLQTKKHYFMTKMKNWHKNYRVELTKEKMSSFNFNLYKSNDVQWTEGKPLFLESYQLVLKESKLDHMIVVVIIDKVDEVSAIDANKRAFDRIFSTLPDSPSVLLYFTEAAAEKLDANKPGAQLSIYYHRKMWTNTIHCHVGPLEVNELNSAVFWTLHKHLRKICGIDPKATEELAPFQNSRSHLQFGKDYKIEVVAAELA